MDVRTVACFREKQRELERLHEQLRAAERERRSTAAKSSSLHGVGADGRKMLSDQQQQQQEQRRERELIVDKDTVGCVADAVNQHFQESLKHVEQKVKYVGTS